APSPVPLAGGVPSDRGRGLRASNGEARRWWSAAATQRGRRGFADLTKPGPHHAPPAAPPLAIGPASSSLSVYTKPDQPVLPPPHGRGRNDWLIYAVGQRLTVEWMPPSAEVTAPGIARDASEAT